MSDLQVVVFTVLWVVLGGLGTLVFLLYREVERAYIRGTEARSLALLPGVEAPDLEIMIKEGGEAPLEFPHEDELGILLFLTTTCTTCVELLDKLVSVGGPVVRTEALVSGEGLSRYAGYNSEGLRVSWLSHPPEATRSYGVTITPAAYVVRGRTVLGSTVVKTPKDLEELVAKASELERELAQEVDGPAVSTPV